MWHRMMWVSVVTMTLVPDLALADRRAEAEKLAAAGELLFEAGKYEDALRQFLDAYALFDPPRFVIPEVIWNIGRCYEEMGDDETALRYFKEFAQVVKEPQYRTRADAKVKEVLGRIQATLALDVQPEGVRVTVDGRLVGETPLAGPLRLEPGRHVITFQRDGYRDRTEELTLKARETRALRFALERKVGTIRVVGVGGPAKGPVRVLVDGQEVYRGFLSARIEVPAGHRVVRVEGPVGTEPLLRYVNVPDQGEVEVAMEFPVLPQAAPEREPTATLPRVGIIGVSPREAGLAQEPQQEHQQSAQPAMAVTARAGRAFPWHFVAIGTGSAMLVGGAVMTGLAAKDRAKVTEAETYPDGTVKGITQTSASSAVSSARIKDKVSYVLYGVGGAAVVGGFLWWVLGTQEADEKGAVYPVPSAVDGGALVGAVGRF